MTGIVRLGLVVRESEDEAWLAAYQRLPLNRADRMVRTLARTAADVRRLAGLDAGAHRLGPYLVGTPETVAAEIAAHVRAGCRAFIVDADWADVVALFARASTLATPERVP
jgi:alkanesulfonate monooxygenase